MNTTIELTQEEKCIKIAEACGWKLNPKKHTAKILDWINMAGETAYNPPRYFHDLNAMHEAEKVIIKRGLMHGMEGYDNVLCGIMDNGNNVHATAAQKAEAFGKTLELW